MSDLPPATPRIDSERQRALVPEGARRPRAKGFFPPAMVRAICFYVISFCIVASVVVCILAIWDFTKKDSLWRLVASFVVVGAGTALFAMVNGIFGEEKDTY
jgi:hypothetical protein